MKYAITFGAVSLAMLALATQLPAAGSWLAISIALAFGGVALGYAGLGPRVFLKRRGGQLHPLSYLIFWPVHLLNWISLWFFRRATREHLWVEVAPNLWLGPRLDEASAREAVAGGVQAVLDLAAELPECRVFRDLNAYRNLPVLDTRAPGYRELHEVIRWVNGFRALGPVYVHCALGHGRSATVVAGCLVMNGECPDWEAAEDRLRALRPGVKLKPNQRMALKMLALRLRG